MLTLASEESPDTPEVVDEEVLPSELANERLRSVLETYFSQPADTFASLPPPEPELLTSRVAAQLRGDIREFVESQPPEIVVFFCVCVLMVDCPLTLPP
jgi:hypothetical protein